MKWIKVSSISVSRFCLLLTKSIYGLQRFIVPCTKCNQSFMNQRNVTNGFSQSNSTSEFLDWRFQYFVWLDSHLVFDPLNFGWISRFSHRSSSSKIIIQKIIQSILFHTNFITGRTLSRSWWNIHRHFWHRLQQPRICLGVKIDFRGERLYFSYLYETNVSGRKKIWGDYF